MSRIEESIYDDFGYLLSWKMGYDIDADDNHKCPHIPVAYFTDVKHIYEWMEECGYAELPDCYIIDNNIPMNEGPSGITTGRETMSNENEITTFKDEMGMNEDYDDTFKDGNI